MRKLGIYDFQSLCREMRWFTRGDIMQYEAVTCYAMNLTPEDALKCSYAFESVVYMTWICSNIEEITVNEIRSILYDRVKNL